MSLCRTCLSKKDLKPLFSDKNIVGARVVQLYTVTGLKIEPNDGLTQVICTPCNNLINGAIKLRELSSEAEQILRKTIKKDISQNDTCLEQKSISHNDIKVVKKCCIMLNDIPKSEQKNSIDKKGINLSETKSNFKLSEQKRNIVLKLEQKEDITQSKDKKFGVKSERGITLETEVKIEDYESSNDSDIQGDFILEDLELSGEEKKISIEDFESSDSSDLGRDDTEVKKERESFRTTWELWEKQFLEREKKKTEVKVQDCKLMSLAVKPYDPGLPIKCNICSKEVINVHNFKNHAKTHFEPENACEECGHKFISRSHMRYHQQRKHGRMKRLACSECSFRAVELSQLQNHIRAAHTGERPYICDVCGDSFRMRPNIVQHMRRHFGVKNIQCEYCPTMFRSRSELTSHQNKVHKHKYTYFCYLCSATYQSTYCARKHIAKVHGVGRDQQLPLKLVKTSRR